MHVTNVHRRHIRADRREVGELIDSLATRDDRLWPHQNWPAMRFDTSELVIGAVGGHGPIGYAVRGHQPQHSATFEFLNRPAGLRGIHTFVVVPDHDGCVLWHITDGELSGLMRLWWLLFIRSLHDALIEDALTCAHIEVGDPAARCGPRWSVWVRTLRAVDRRAVMLRQRPRSHHPPRPGTPQPATTRTRLFRCACCTDPGSHPQEPADEPAMSTGISPRSPPRR